MKKIYQEDENGYVCFSKSIHLQNTQKDFDQLIFPYKIKDSYTSTIAQNNIIKCQIISNDGGISEGNIGFTFSTFGSNGTDYTLVVKPKDILLNTKKNNQIFPLKVEVYGKDGEEKDISKISTFWVNPNGNSSHTKTAYTANVVEGNVIEISDNGNSYKCGILKIEAEISDNGKKIVLDTLYAIPWSYGEKKDFYQLSGPIGIVYNSQGILMNYDKTPYALLKDNSLLENISFKINCLDSSFMSYTNNNSYKDSILIKWMPSLGTGNIEGILISPTLYMENVGLYACVEAWSNNTLLFVQPLTIEQDRFESNYLNKWDGELVVDKDNNRIMSAMVGAGVKNNDNSFSGVLMGNVKGKAGVAESGIGLYGFHKGGQSFGFNIDGTAFIGKSGTGRIEFDGTNSLIRSALWDGEINNDGKIIKAGTQGMAISLKTGHIDAHAFKLTSKNIQLNSGEFVNENNPYLLVGDENSFIKFTSTGGLNIKVASFSLTSANALNKTVIDALDGTFVSNTDLETALGRENTLNRLVQYGDGIYFLEDGNLYICANGIATGYLRSKKEINGIPNMTIDMDTGYIDAYNFKLTGGDSLYLNSNPNDYYFKVKHKNNYLQFTEDGALQINVEGDNSYFNAKNFTLEATSPINEELNINDYWNEYRNEPTTIKLKVEAQVCLQIAVELITFDNYESHLSGGWSFVLDHWKSHLGVKSGDLTKAQWDQILKDVYDINKNEKVDIDDSRYILRMSALLQDLSSRQFKLKFNKDEFSIERHYGYTLNNSKIDTLFKVTEKGVQLSEVQLFNMSLLSNEDTKYAIPKKEGGKVVDYEIKENSIMPNDYKIEENGRYFKIEPFQLVEKITEETWTVDHPYSALVADFEGYGAFTGGNDTEVVQRRLWITPKEIVSQVNGIKTGSSYYYLSLDWHDLITAATRIIRNWPEIKAGLKLKDFGE